MRRDLGAAVPREPQAPMASILGFIGLTVGLSLSALSMLVLLLVMMGGF